MQYRQIVSWVTKLEGKKKSIGVGQVREVLKCLKKVYQHGPEQSVAIVEYLDKPDRRGRPVGAKGKKKRKAKVSPRLVTRVVDDKKIQAYLKAFKLVNQHKAKKKK